jgi:hypothetical protein
MRETLAVLRSIRTNYQELHVRLRVDQGLRRKHQIHSSVLSNRFLILAVVTHSSCPSIHHQIIVLLL